MSLLVVAALLGSSAAPPSPPPPVLLFNFYRVLVFQQMAQEHGCGTADLDRDLAEIRKQLVKRYGKKGLFPPRDSPTRMWGDCDLVVSQYRYRLGELRRDAAAALTAPAPSPAAE